MKSKNDEMILYDKDKQLDKYEALKASDAWSPSKLLPWVPSSCELFVFSFLTILLSVLWSLERCYNLETTSMNLKFSKIKKKAWRWISRRRKQLYILLFENALWTFLYVWSKESFLLKPYSVHNTPLQSTSSHLFYILPHNLSIYL